MLRCACLFTAAVLLAGCNQFLAQHMVAPPNGGDVDVGAALPVEPGETAMRIPVGPPDAQLAAWVRQPQIDPPHGTILVLHGFINDHSQMESAAQSLVHAGFRAVSVDLRGHGHSTGDHITYGADDARDLVQVTDYLQKHNLCGKQIGVLGASYGAATAILFAGADPRVTAVVAIAPFDTLRSEAPYFGKHVLPVPGLFMSPKDFTEVVNLMGRIADFDPDAVSPLKAIQSTHAHVRLFHGDLDMIIPAESSKRLAAAAPDRTELTILPVQGHLDLTFDPLGELHEGTREWFDRYLSVNPTGHETAALTSR